MCGSGEPCKVAAGALDKLKKRGTKVGWVSGIPMEPALRETFSGLLDVQVVEGDLLDAVAAVFNVDVSSLKPYAIETKRPAGAVKAYHELIEASMYAYRNYQDEESYAKVVGYLANGVSESAWSPDAQRLVAHYRRYRGRELVGKSTAMRRLQERINKAAAHPDARVLVIGESGTGKETVALQIL